MLCVLCLLLSYKPSSGLEPVLYCSYESLGPEYEKELEAYLQSLDENGASKPDSVKPENVVQPKLETDGTEGEVKADGADGKYVMVAICKGDDEVEYAYVKRQIASDYVPEEDEEEDLRLYGNTEISADYWAEFRKKHRRTER